VDTRVPNSLNVALLFINPLTKKYTREMDSPGFMPGIRGLKITLVAGLTLLTTDALFAQSTDQNGVDSLKTQMNQMQRQYEQRIEAMEAKMKALETNANSGSILNARVLTDADGKGVAPAPMLDESFLKSLTRNFTFSVYIRSGVGFNGNGGPQDFSFSIPENVGGRWRLGNENDTYMEITWKQAHLLGDSPDVMDVSMTFTPRFSWSNTKTTSDSQFAKGTVISMRQAYLEAKNFIKSAPEVTIWGGQRFYDRHDIHIHDYFFDDYSGYGLGVDNIDLGFGKLLVSYLGGIRDDFDNGNTNTTDTTINDPRRGGFYMHTADVRIHDIDLLGGKLELIGDYSFFKGGTYQISGSPDLVVGDTSGFRVGAIYQHPFGGYTPPPPPAPGYSKEGKPVAAPPPAPAGPTIAPSFWQIGAFFGYGAGEIMGVDPNGGQSGNVGRIPGFEGVNGGSPFAGYNFNANAGNIFVRPDGSTFIDSGSLRHATRIRANAQVVWNVSARFSIGAAAYWEYDDQGSLSAERFANGTFRTTGGSRNTVGAGIRPVFWLNDWFALQGQAGWDWTSRSRSSSLSTFQSGGPGGVSIPTNDTFGKSGSMGIFTIAPTVKPIGGFFTRPEFRAFATYAIWSNGLKGAIGGTQYQNNNQGWVFGVQTEWFF
jgi:maltoporin